MFHSPKPLLRARSIAIVSASDRARWPVSIYHNLTSTKAKILPINPSRDEVWGLACYPNFSSLPMHPDLEINPLIIRDKGKGIRAVDIRFHLHKKFNK